MTHSVIHVGYWITLRAVTCVVTGAYSIYANSTATKLCSLGAKLEDAFRLCGSRRNSPPSAKDWPSNKSMAVLEAESFTEADKRFD